MSSGRRPKRRDRTVVFARNAEEKRKARRNAAERFRTERKIEDMRNIAEGRPGDVDFQRLVKYFRKTYAPPDMPEVSTKASFLMSSESRCKIFCRKRPVNTREKSERDYDVVSVFRSDSNANDNVIVHIPQMLVDGCQKRLKNWSFKFHEAFDTDSSNELVYRKVCRNLVQRFLKNGMPSLLFATGQTGSGKTYSIRSMLSLASKDIFAHIKRENKGQETTESKRQIAIVLQSFEIYGESLFDLLRAGHKAKRVLHARVGKEPSPSSEGKGLVSSSTPENGVVIQGLSSMVCTSESDFMTIITAAQRNRATKSTRKNKKSSRSHWIVCISIPWRRNGTLTIVDLAGSERQNDSSEHSASLMKEAALINSSILALKHAIRALGQRQQQRLHRMFDDGKNDQTSRKKTRIEIERARKDLGAAFRGSKLTMVLRDFLIHPKCFVHILCTVAPTASSSHHTLETLRMASQLLGQDHSNTVIIDEPPNTSLGSDSNDRRDSNDIHVPKITSVKGVLKESVPENRNVTDPSPRKRSFLKLLKKKVRGPRRPQKLNLDHLEPPPAPSSPSFSGLSPMAYEAAAASSRRRGSRQLEHRASLPVSSLPPPPPQPENSPRRSMLRSKGSMISMMESSPVLVAVRIRPVSKADRQNGAEVVVRATSKSTIVANDVEKTNSEAREAQLFTFDAVIPPTACQSETYARTGHLLLKKVLRGINGCIIAYGQTGAGKTYTLLGKGGDARESGVLLSFVRELFQTVNPESTTVKATVCEIYREKLNDLVDPSRSPTIVGNPLGGVHVQNVAVTEIKSIHDMESLLWAALARRVTGSTQMNKRSSRSHAVVTLYVRTKFAGSVLHSKMIFCDLVSNYFLLFFF